VNALREEIDCAMPADSTLEQVITHALTFHDADSIRDDIDKVNAT
jgi:predicted small metal-binding protein